MAAFLIDPFTQTFEDVEASFDPAVPFLDTMRKVVGAHQLAIMGIADNRLALVIDNFGLLKREQAYWRFVGDDNKLAGKAVMFAVDHNTGALAPIRPEAIDELRAGIVFCPDASLIRVEEVILTEPGKAPFIARIPVYSDDPTPPALAEIADEARTVAPMVPEGHDASQSSLEAPPAAIVDSGWVVQASKSGGVRATRYRLQDGVLTPYEMRTAEDLTKLREQMPPGMKQVDPGDDEPVDVLELWVEAGRAA